MLSWVGGKELWKMSEGDRVAGGAPKTKGRESSTGFAVKAVGGGGFFVILGWASCMRSSDEITARGPREMVGAGRTFAIAGFVDSLLEEMSTDEMTCGTWTLARGRVDVVGGARLPKV